MAIRRRDFFADASTEEQDPRQPQVMTVPPPDATPSDPYGSTQPPPSASTMGRPVDAPGVTDPPVHGVAPAPTPPVDPTTPPVPGATPPTIPPVSKPASSTPNYILAGMPMGNANDSPKRAATAYLASGAANPNTKDWAPAAASYLNATYPAYGGVFHAIDGETLGYGDEFIHSAPVGHGLHSGEYDPNAAGEFFWGSNGPGPWDAPTGGGGASSSGASRSGGAVDLSTLLNLFGGLGKTYGGPGDSGVFPSDPLQQVGQDPFSQLITGGLSALIGSGGRGLAGPTHAEQVAAMESARAPYEAARRVQLENARAELANRGLLSEPGVPQGSEAGAIGRIEERLAPAYTAAIDQNLLELRNQSNTEAQTMLGALQAATQRQGVLGQLAIQTLAENNAFAKFLAEFGLKRDETLYRLASGQDEQLLMLFSQWLQAAGVSAGGFV